MPSDPFDFSNADPNAAGFLGIAPSAWRDLAAFGGNLASAANARTASGHLANGTGFAGPLGAAIGPTMEFGRQNAVTRSNLGMQAANTRGRQIENMLLESSLPTQLARNKMLQDIFQDPAKLNQLMQQFGGGGTAPGGGFGGALAASESSGNPAATNSAGYSGQHQFGSERLADLGFYKPAQGENLKANQWAGQFAIPGFPEVRTQSDFLASQPAQNAAYHAHIQNIDQAIAQTPGAQGLDPNGLRAVAHLGGVHGMQQFVQTGGKYNPTDSNGTSLTDYYRKFSGAGGASPAAGPRAQVPGSFQVAQAGQGALPLPPQPPEQQPSAQAPQQQPQGITPEEAGRRAEVYEQRANDLERQISVAEQTAKFTGLPIPKPAGDPAALRAAASQFRQLSLAGPTAAAQAGAKLQTAGPIAAAESQARLPGILAEKGFSVGPLGNMIPIPGGPADPAYVGAVESQKKMAEAQVTLKTVGPIEAAKENQRIITDRFGNMYRGGQYLGRGSEVKPVFDAATGREHYGDVGGVGIGAQQPGAAGGPAIVPATAELPIAKLSPAEQGRLTAAGKIEGEDLEHDRKIIETDLAHVVDNTIQGKANMLKLRDLIDPSATGFGAETRQAFKSAIQTLSPSFANAIDINASPGEELKKISTMGAGKSEREDQGAKGGLRLMQIYMEANPNLGNQPESNRHMANMILMAHQLHEDYATGANDFYQKNREGFRGPTHEAYKPVSQYDQAFIQKMRPEVYKSATDALNGKPYTEWSKGLTGPQMQIVGGILQRADPNAQVDLQGHMVPVNAFTKTIGPMDIMGASGGR